MGFSFGRLGHGPGVGLRGTVGGGGGGGAGGQKIFFLENQPDFVCELLTWMAHAPAQFFLVPAPWGLGEGSKI